MTHYSKHLLRQRFVLLLTQLLHVVHLFHQLMVPFPHLLAYR